MLSFIFYVLFKVIWQLVSNGVAPLRPLLASQYTAMVPIKTVF